MSAFFGFLAFTSHTTCCPWAPGARPLSSTAIHVPVASHWYAQLKPLLRSRSVHPAACRPLHLNFSGILHPLYSKPNTLFLLQSSVPQYPTISQVTQSRIMGVPVTSWATHFIAPMSHNILPLNISNQKRVSALPPPP